ncbi:MAG: type II toxin-antitoxin system prevent-host-death family antitoxin [Acidimicrobiaceae bacterium]|nr:type II toxin-antitoxin system prevent-host-death family antitoxin [Acidimicrobiaceae bacterium]MXZ97490.1 type II toxin-antitoxin system prevent-host-death family antitoxin [Acidimicrobiaceae bacterium]MYE75932.1 type II toxin-antitoxin system prevent-host-death family antitoxin [Acidimicrobiaceae bacterium]MYE96938.1 type II toxin-antitoxin system prevent-host-death family antitoxin [Acidimicrobiaceae bacterium]MYH43657.1 type II toxin-antitoxin system prevent-host-death family antitoxin [
MERIGVRELRQHASRWLRRVAEGETYEITVRGVPVARLSPVAPPGSVLERLAAEGLVTLATENLDEVMERLGLPLEIPPGEQSPSERLAELRRDER